MLTKQSFESYLGIFFAFTIQAYFESLKIFLFVVSILTAHLYSYYFTGLFWSLLPTYGLSFRPRALKFSAKFAVVIRENRKNFFFWIRPSRPTLGPITCQRDTSPSSSICTLTILLARFGLRHFTPPTFLALGP